MFDFSFNLTNTYTFWSGVIGGTFLMLSYFGTDQSQVQRYLAAKSVDEARSSLLISAYWKIPLQAMVLLIGVLVFVFYQFEPAAAALQSGARARVRAAQPAAYGALESRYTRHCRTRRGRAARSRRHAITATEAQAASAMVAFARSKPASTPCAPRRSRSRRG